MYMWIKNKIKYKYIYYSAQHIQLCHTVCTFAYIILVMGTWGPLWGYLLIIKIFILKQFWWIILFYEGFSIRLGCYRVVYSRNSFRHENRILFLFIYRESCY